MRLTIDTDGPARVEVRDAAGRMFQPDGALMDRTVGKWPAIPPYYQGHFVSKGTASLDVPSGRYLVVVEKGLEFERLEIPLDLDADRMIRAVPGRWAHQAAAGWYSADFHVHRPVSDASELLLAEDLNLGVFFTQWNEHNEWPQGEPVVQVDATHMATATNSEDERGGGAWMFHNLSRPLPLGEADWWYPQGRGFVDEARSQDAWFDCEKPIWWEVPVMAALAPFDSVGVLNNHYNQYGMNSHEAWGRPRDDSDFSDYSLGLYYRLLNLGHRLPVTAGSASGVLPAPPGYNRVYVPIADELSVASFYAALRAGRSFATNGPMVSFTVDGATPGDSVDSGRVSAVVTATARESIDRVEIVANGEVIADASGPALEQEISLDGYSWVIARCYLKPGDTVRMAHTSPIYVRDASWDTTADNAYFVRWIDDLIAESADPARFSNNDQRDEVLRIYQTARSHYDKMAASDSLT
jgi:hypothetical protein